MNLGAYVLDCSDPAGLAGFYAALLGWPEPETEPEWATLTNPAGGAALAFQRDPDHQPSTWPSRDRAQMAHLDLQVADMDAEQARALGLGATLLDDSAPTFRVFADPAGHPFCLCAC